MLGPKEIAILAAVAVLLLAAVWVASKFKKGKKATTSDQ